MTSVLRLTCLAAMAALALGACTPKSSGNAGPSFVDSGARDLRVDRGNDAGADDTAATDTGANPDAGSDAATPDAPVGDTPTSDAPTDTSGPGDTGAASDARDSAGDTGAASDARDSAGDTGAASDARDSAGDPTVNLDLAGLDLRDALPTDLGADTRDGGG